MRLRISQCARAGWACALALGLSAAAGCGDDVVPVVPTPDAGPPDSGRPDAGMPDAGMPDAGMPDAGFDSGPPDAGPGDGGGPCDIPGGPQVSIMSPTVALDPNDDDVVTGDRLTVRCRAVMSGDVGAGRVVADSVVVTLLDLGGEVLATPPVMEVEPGIFEANLLLASFESGPVVVRCFALDDSEEEMCGLDEVDTFIDRGPAIAIDFPARGSIHATRMDLRYRVEPDPLAEGDTEAAVVRHTLTVAGAVIEDVVDMGDGSYRADIDFADRSVYPEPLPDAAYQIEIEADNARTPTAGHSLLTQPFRLDVRGPLIDIVTPDEGDLVGGLFEVRAEITDPAGVDPATVFLRVGGSDLLMTLDPLEDDTYVRSFDASRFGRTVTEITINVTASDVAGNGSAAARGAKLDSVPPFADLDPPPVREARIRTGMFECSELFDPVGSDSVVDGQVVGTAAEFRARVEDVANSSFGGSGTVVFLAGVDEEAVDLYVLDDVTVPLLVDTNADGVCDSINPEVEPVTGGDTTAVILELAAVAPAGRSFFPVGDMTVGSPAFAACGDGTDATPPPPLCDLTSPLTRVISSTYDDRTAAIFGKPPIIRMETCVGDAWDFQTSIDEGWACAAIKARDQLGNTGVSEALRVCFTDGAGIEPCPAPLGSIASEALRPSCTDGCRPPTGFSDIDGYQLIEP